MKKQKNEKIRAQNWTPVCHRTFLVFPPELGLLLLKKNSARCYAHLLFKADRLVPVPPPGSTGGVAGHRNTLKPCPWCCERDRKVERDLEGLWWIEKNGKMWKMTEKDGSKRNMVTELIETNGKMDGNEMGMRPKRGAFSFSWLLALLGFTWLGFTLLSTWLYLALLGLALLSTCFKRVH